MSSSIRIHEHITKTPHLLKKEDVKWLMDNFQTIINTRIRYVDTLLRTHGRKLRCTCAPPECYVDMITEWVNAQKCDYCHVPITKKMLYTVKKHKKELAYGPRSYYLWCTNCIKEQWTQNFFSFIPVSAKVAQALGD